MNERLNLQDLIDLLAKKREITKKDAEAFLRELIALISENIEHDPVKIKDFGTFKLVLVSARKSVDVNTGEAIEIPAHYKLSFTPDKALREAVNRPFSHFESVVIEDGISFDAIESEQKADDIEEDITDEEDENSVVAEDPKPDANVKNEDAALADEIAVSESEVTHDNSIEVEDASEISIDEIKTIEKDSVDEDNDELLDSDYTDENKSSKKVYVVAIIVIFLLGLIIAGGLYFQEIKNAIMRIIPSEEVVRSARVIEDTIKQETDSIIGSSVPETMNADSIAPVKEDKSNVPESKADVVKDASAPIGVETIQTGHTLRLISLKYYGHKSFWVYIYQENPGKIKNPNNVPLGTRLTIPSPEKYGIDAKNAQSVKKAMNMETEIFSKPNTP